jgi:hypothetical protein
MSGVYGNPNLAYVQGCQYLTFDGTSDLTAALLPVTQAVTLYATADCWVQIAPAPVAAAPGGEKTRVHSFFLPANTFVDVAVPYSDEAHPQIVAAIQATAGGNLYIYERTI